MFTGLVEDVGIVERVTRGAMADLWIRTRLPVGELPIGSSIAVDGACLTVVETRGNTFKVQASFETLRRTTLDLVQPSSRVNLERALRVGDRLGGHWVLGHVDAVARVLEKRPEGGAVIMVFSIPTGLEPFFVAKGSVAVDGISLTVNGLWPGRFDVALIPQTQNETTLSEKAVGSAVNLEADLFGKYVARLGALRGTTLDAAAIARAGFGP